MIDVVQKNRKIVKISKRKLGLVIVAVVMALMAWYGTSFYFQNQTSTVVNGGMSYGDTSGLTMAKPESVSLSDVSKIMPPDSIINNQQISISDTREFLKTNYSASIKTRDVQGIVNNAKNIIKGNDGRIDNLSSSEKSGYLTFVVPKSKFETFRKEIEGLTHRKLFSETNSSQNLLGEKQSIEQRISNINNTLDNLKQQKESLLSSHTQTVASINKELQSIKAELNVVRKTIEATVDPGQLTLLRSQESVLVKREATQKQKLVAENNNYSVGNTNLDNQIKNQNTSLVNVNKQDTNFNDNIETVNGSINVSWISVWQMIKAFSPVPPEILIIVLVLIIWNILARLGYVPKFIFE